MTTSPSVGVIGAGLSGLMFACIMQQHGYNVSVYEAETSANARAQGGVFDIHAHSGQQALAAAGLLEKFHTLTHKDGQFTRIVNSKNVIQYDEVPTYEGENPEIDRGVLRQLLLDEMKPESLHWGAKVIRVSDETGKPVVHLADGTTASFDLIVGADGAWSKVRHLLTKVKPHYTGFTFVESQIQDMEERHPHLKKLLGTGTLFAFHYRQLIAAHTTRHPWIVAAFHVPEDWYKGIDWSDTERARQMVLQQFSDWDPSLQELLATTDGQVIPRPIYAMPIGMHWKHKPGLTMIGDSAHVMSPCAGEGANLALLDGAELAKALIAQPEDWDAALLKAEQALFARSWKPALSSMLNTSVFFGPARAAGFYYRTIGKGAVGLAARLAYLAVGVTVLKLRMALPGTRQIAQRRGPVWAG